MKRYEHYKDSGIDWIGEIPEHWEVSKIKFIGQIRGRIGYRGYTTQDLVSEGEGAYAIGGKHISNNYLDLSDPEYISWNKYWESPEIMVSKGDILIAQRGTLKRAALVTDDIGAATINPSLVLFTRITECRKFIHFYLSSSSTNDFIDVLNTSTAVPMISQNQIENIIIALPPLAEQEAIAEYLSTKTSCIEMRNRERERELRLLDELRQAEISRVVTRGLNPDVKLKDSGIPWIGLIPEHWEVCKVKHHYTLQTGFTPDTKKSSYYDPVNGYDWVNIGDIKGRTVFSTENKISQQFVDEANPLIVPAGSLLYSFKLSVGQVAFAGKDIYTNEAIASFLDSENIYLPFLYYSAQYYIIHNANTNIYGAKILNQDLIKNAIIVFPPLEEQIAIANYLDSQSQRIDEEMEKCRRQIELLKELKQSLISQAVTGKINVTDQSMMPCHTP